MPYTLPVGFQIAGSDPIDDRFATTASADRFTYKAAGVMYHGLTVYTSESQAYFVLGDTANYNNNAGWSRIYTSDLGGKNLEISGSLKLPQSADGTDRIHFGTTTGNNAYLYDDTSDLIFGYNDTDVFNITDGATKLTVTGPSRFNYLSTFDDIHVVGDISASGILSASSGVFQNITASNNISASNQIYAQEFKVGPNGLVEGVGSGDYINFGTNLNFLANVDFIVDAQTDIKLRPLGRTEINSDLDVDGNLSASGDISASGFLYDASYPNPSLSINGDISGSNILADGDISASGNYYIRPLKAIFSSTNPTNTRIYLGPTVDTWQIYAGGIYHEFSPTATVFNQGGVDNDFRIESNIYTNAFTVDANRNKIGFFYSPNDNSKDVSINGSVWVSENISASLAISGAGLYIESDGNSPYPQISLFSQAGANVVGTVIGKIELGGKQSEESGSAHLIARTTEVQDVVNNAGTRFEIWSTPNASEIPERVASFQPSVTSISASKNHIVGDNITISSSNSITIASSSTFIGLNSQGIKIESYGNDLLMRSQNIYYSSSYSDPSSPGQHFFGDGDVNVIDYDLEFLSSSDGSGGRGNQNRGIKRTTMYGTQQYAILFPSFSNDVHILSNGKTSLNFASNRLYSGEVVLGSNQYDEGGSRYNSEVLRATRKKLAYIPNIFPDDTGWITASIVQFVGTNKDGGQTATSHGIPFFEHHYRFKGSAHVASGANIRYLGSSEYDSTNPGLSFNSEDGKGENVMKTKVVSLNRWGAGWTASDLKNLPGRYHELLDPTDTLYPQFNAAFVIAQPTISQSATYVGGDNKSWFKQEAREANIFVAGDQTGLISQKTGINSNYDNLLTLRQASTASSGNHHYRCIRSGSAPYDPTVTKGWDAYYTIRAKDRGSRGNHHNYVDITNNGVEYSNNYNLDTLNYQFDPTNYEYRVPMIVTGSNAWSNDGNANPINSELPLFKISGEMGYDYIWGANLGDVNPAYISTLGWLEFNYTGPNTFNHIDDYKYYPGAGQGNGPLNYLVFAWKYPFSGDYEIAVPGKISLTDDGDSVDFWQQSDRRLKCNITSSKRGINDLMKIKVRDFNWKSNPTSSKSMGFIAQEVFEDSPRELHLASPGGDNPKSTPWSISQQNFVPLLVKSIQDQQKMIEELQEEIKSLKNKIN